MKALKRTTRPTRIALIVAAAGIFPLAAQAQDASMADMQARYKEDIQRCETLTDPEAKRTCRREAGAAIQEARRNRLVTGSGDPMANAVERCQRLPANQRADCEQLMRDSSATERGSVSGGGVIRELTITVPADPGTSGSTYGTPPASTYQGTTPAPAPGYQGTAPATPTPVYPNTAPAPSTYGTQPAQPSGSYTQPSAPSTYGTQPAR